MVRIPVAIPTALLPNKLVVSVVARAEAEIFTMLLPINIVLISLSLLEISLRTLAARLFPLSAIERRVNLLTVVRAVSAEEKNADNRINRIIVNNWIIVLGCKKDHLLKIFLLLIVQNRGNLVKNRTAKK